MKEKTRGSLPSNQVELSISLVLSASGKAARTAFYALFMVKTRTMKKQAEIHVNPDI